MFLELLPWYLAWALNRYWKDKEANDIHNGIVKAINSSPTFQKQFIEYCKTVDPDTLKGK